MTDIVDMWHDERGTGDPVVLLHGGLTDSRCFTGNLDGLADTFQLYLPDRRGHGRTPDAPGPITIELMAQDTIAFLEKVVGGPARLVGYSAGGTVALAGEGCLKIYTDTATGTKADRPQWKACLADLRPGDTLIIWKILRRHAHDHLPQHPHRRRSNARPRAVVARPTTPQLLPAFIPRPGC